MPVTSPISWISGTAQSSSDLQGHQCAMCVMYSTVHTYISTVGTYLGICISHKILGYFLETTHTSLLFVRDHQ